MCHIFHTFCFIFCGEGVLNSLMDGELGDRNNLCCNVRSFGGGVFGAEKFNIKLL
jgi:hypothetical protein